MQNRGAIFGIAALSLIASVAAAQNPPSQAAQESAGFAAYQKACAACHNGGDETAPPADRLQALGRDRIIRALSPGGIMAGQASALSEASRGAKNRAAAPRAQETRRSAGAASSRDREMWSARGGRWAGAGAWPPGPAAGTTSWGATWCDSSAATTLDARPASAVRATALPGAPPPLRREEAAALATAA